MKVVVVESPSKAKTINKYLGPDYHVLASFGHVRDLPSKTGSVDPDDHFAMKWEVAPESEKHMKDIVKALKGADELLLATDPDREGEAISWHVQQVLEEQKALKNIGVKRVVFYEVTKKAVTYAVENPRVLNQELVEAYLARRALDYLVGFTLSPVLWRKLPGSKSAGRVQSVALRLISERESEIEAFRSQEYWSILGHFLGKPSKRVGARLTHLDGKKLEKFTIGTEAQALAAKATIEAGTYSVLDVEKKQTKRNPQPPFTTSTLQQEASRKLGFGARKTMQIAQRLYEGVQLGGEVVGLITYMRTDSVNLSADAVTATRDFITKNFGTQYCPKEPRLYKSKAKNAQEAHEAVRPTDIMRTPDQVRDALDYDQLRLYELVWQRMLSCQMESALIDQVGVDIGNPSKTTMLRATGATIAFDGFLKVYEEGRDDEVSEDEAILPPLVVGEALDLSVVDTNQHFTQPPPRYSEASLVKRLEELGIGRPSTYASIISTLLDRKYVTLDKKRLAPEALGRLVTSFLTSYFKTYVEYDFTAHLEEELDEIAAGKRSWQGVLETFWKAFHATIEATGPLKITDVIHQIEDDLAQFIFGDTGRVCPKCADGRLGLRLGKWGAFVGCTNYPTCDFTRKVLGSGDGPVDDTPLDLFETKTLGTDPANGATITVRKGPYGFYLQWDGGVQPEPAKPAKPPKAGAKPKKVAAPKPKRVSLPAGVTHDTVTLEQALSLGALPRFVGTHPETGDPITAALGRFGPYVKYQDRFKSVGKTDDILTITLERAVELLAQPVKPRRVPVRKAPAKKKATAKK